MTTPRSGSAAEPSLDTSVMQGKGFYNEHSRPQGGAGDLGLPLLERAAAAVPVPSSAAPLAIADLGSSEGRNSMEPIAMAIAALRHRAGPALPIAVVHTDLPSNDFTSLFELLATGPTSYLRDAANVFAYAAGKSFYEPLFPPAQITLGWSSITVHWLSAVPCPIPGDIWSPRATGDVRAAWRARSRDDWQAFLEDRARELVPGGQLVIVGSGADDRGFAGAEGLTAIANDALQALVRDGTLRESEYARMAIPTYYRTPAEWQAPFAAPPLAGVLSLEECTPAVLPDPYWPAYEASKDAGAFADQYDAFFRAFSEPSLFGSLDADRTPADHERLADTFYARVRDAIAADPAKAVCHWQLALLRIAKAG